MSDQYFDEELSELVRKTVAEELAKRAKAKEEPKSNFENRVAGWLDTSIEDPEDEEPETDAEQATRWMEADKKPELNAFGNVIGTPDELWDQARGPDKIIESVQEDITERFQRWVDELSDE